MREGGETNVRETDGFDNVVREDHRPLLRQANASVEQRIKVRFHVILEHLSNSEICQLEMSGLPALVVKEVLHVCRIGGCAVGYRDLDSGRPYLKPMVIVTLMDVLAEALRSRRCCCRCSHEQLHGQNPQGARSLQVTDWALELNNIVATSIIQQAAVDNVIESFQQYPVDETQREPAGSLRSFPAPNQEFTVLVRTSVFRILLQRRLFLLLCNMMNPPPYSLMDSVPYSQMHLLPYSVMGSHQMPKSQNRENKFLSIPMVKELEMLMPEILFQPNKGDRRRAWLQIDSVIRKAFRQNPYTDLASSWCQERGVFIFSPVMRAVILCEVELHALVAFLVDTFQLRH